MLHIWHTLKGYAAAVVAVVACPCHLPLTLPLLIALTAGTAFSAWLQHNVFTVGAVSTVIFLGGLALATKWIGQKNEPLPDPHTGVPKVTLITSAACGPVCDEAKAVWREVREQHKFKFEAVDIASPRGRDLAAQHNIFAAPTTLVNERVAFRGVPKRDHAAAAVRR